MFKFRFIADDDTDERSPGVATTMPTSLPIERIPSLRPSLEIHGQSHDDLKQSEEAVELFEVSNDITIVRRVGVVGGVENHASDLIAGEYEGGYKVWECSIDLSRYIADKKEEFCNKRILELGCGQGLAGITASVCGSEVHFQDYDADVVENLTIPMVMRNAKRMKAMHGMEMKTSRFFAGDWGTLEPLFEDQALIQTYDVVLTSETIYSVESMPRLLGCIKKCLKNPGGVCYVSAKSFYFGVGGGVAAFKSLVEADGDMCHSEIAVIDDGRSNRREIFKLSWL